MILAEAHTSVGDVVPLIPPFPVVSLRRDTWTHIDKHIDTRVFLMLTKRSTTDTRVLFCSATTSHRKIERFHVQFNSQFANIASQGFFRN